MNSIIEHLRSRKRKKPQRFNDELQNTEERDGIIGGIGTIEGRIWIAFQSKLVLSKSIIDKEQDITVLTPTEAVRNLDRGVTGNHDIIITNTGVVELLYCHRFVSKISSGGNVTLCGRTFIIDGDIEQDDDELQEKELKIGEHLKLSSGTIKVRVRAGGHKIYINKDDPKVICSQFKQK